MWLGLYYNSLQTSVADFGAEHDFSTGNFRSFSIENGPLDYYALLGASSISNKTASGPAPKPRLRDIVSQFAALVTPFSPASKQLAGPLASSAPRNFMPNWQASPTLPRLTQFGYLASSMTLAELDNAFLLPHLGSATVDDRLWMMEMAIDNVAAVLRGEPPPHAVV